MTAIFLKGKKNLTLTLSELPLASECMGLLPSGFFSPKMESCYVVKAGLDLLGSCDPLTSVSQAREVMHQVCGIADQAVPPCLALYFGS